MESAKKAVAIPAFITDAITNGTTSLGDNPAFPVSGGNNVMLKLVGAYADKMIPDGVDTKGAKSELSSLVTACSKKEETCHEALEQLCLKCVTDVVSIPEDTINLEMKLVSKVDTSAQRVMPGDDDNFSFDSLDEMRSMSDEIYKRRLVDALVCGAAAYYGNNVSSYVKDLFDIDPELPGMYRRIIDLNNYLMFAEEGTTDSHTSVGKVEVRIGSENEKVSIKAEGTLFPFLLTETFKGIFEVAASHGLPDDMEKAEYVLSRSDYSAAEAWDMRIGGALWDRIAEMFDGIEPNFMLMYLSEMDVEEFNETMKEIIAMTRRGQEIIDGICDEVMEELDRDDFHRYMDAQRERFQINDGYMTGDELMPEGEEEPL